MVKDINREPKLHSFDSQLCYLQAMWSWAALVFLTCKWGQWYLIQRPTMIISEYVKHSEQWLAYSLLSSSNMVPMSLPRLLCSVPFLMNKGGLLVLKDWFKLFFSFLMCFLSSFILWITRRRVEIQGLKLDLDSAFALILILALLLLLCRLDEFMDKHFQLSERNLFCWTRVWLKIKLKDCLALRDIRNSICCVWLFMPGNHGRWKLLMA